MHSCIHIFIVHHCFIIVHHFSSFFIIASSFFTIASPLFYHFHHLFTILHHFSSPTPPFWMQMGPPLLGTPRERLAQLAQSWHAGRDRWPLGGSPPVVPFENDDLATINGVVFPVL